MEQCPEKLNGKNILVTGGAGFIGSHIVDRISPENKVTVLDNLFTGSLSNLEKSQDRITFVKGDILDKALVRDMVTKKEGGYSRESEVTDEDSYSPRKRLAEEGAA